MECRGECGRPIQPEVDRERTMNALRRHIPRLSPPTGPCSPRSAASCPSPLVVLLCEARDVAALAPATGRGRMDLPAPRTGTTAARPGAGRPGRPAGRDRRARPTRRAGRRPARDGLRESHPRRPSRPVRRGCGAVRWRAWPGGTGPPGSVLVGSAGWDQPWPSSSPCCRWAPARILSRSPTRARAPRGPLRITSSSPWSCSSRSRWVWRGTPSRRSVLTVHDRTWFHPTRCSPSAQRRCQRRPCRLARTTPT
jgi:hypothetical protein